MRVTPIPSSWIDRGDVILQGPVGESVAFTVRVPVDELWGLYDESRSADDESARWAGFRWGRDHIAGAMDLAIRAGLVDTCRAVDGRAIHA